MNSDPVARWLAGKCVANFVLLGSTKRLGPGQIEVSARLLSVNDQNRQPSTVKLNVAVDDSVQAVVNKDGGLEDLQITEGAPYGLNEATLRSRP